MVKGTSLIALVVIYEVGDAKIFGSVESSSILYHLLFYILVRIFLHRKTTTFCTTLLITAACQLLKAVYQRQGMGSWGILSTGNIVITTLDHDFTFHLTEGALEVPHLHTLNNSPTSIRRKPVTTATKTI